LINLVGGLTLGIPGVCSVCTASEEPAEPENPSAEPVEKVSFIHQVAPILVRNCQACHGPKAAESNYRLDSFESLMTAGDYDMAPVTGGELDDSELYSLITAEDADQRMPNNGDQLSDEDIQLIARWIEQGAEFDGADPATPLEQQLPRPSYPPAPEVYPASIPMAALAFSSDGQQLFASGYHELTVWDANEGTILRRLGNLPQRVYGIDVSADGEWLAVAGGAPGVTGDAWVIRVADGSVVSFLPRQRDVYFDVAFSPDGKRVALASADGSVCIADPATGEQLQLIENHSDWVHDVAWNTDGTRLASSSRDKAAKVFDAASGELLATYSGHGAEVFSVQFMPDGVHVASGGADNKVHVWKIEDAAKVGEMAGFGKQVTSLIVYSEHVLAGSADQTVRQFKVEDRAHVRSLEEHPDWVLSLAIDGSGQRLAAGSFDGSVSVWNFENGELVKRFQAFPAKPMEPETAPDES